MCPPINFFSTHTPFASFERFPRKPKVYHWKSKAEYAPKLLARLSNFGILPTDESALFQVSAAYKQRKLDTVPNPENPTSPESPLRKVMRHADQHNPPQRLRTLSLSPEPNRPIPRDIPTDISGDDLALNSPPWDRAHSRHPDSSIEDELARLGFPTVWALPEGDILEGIPLADAIENAKHRRLRRRRAMVIMEKWME
ncbi:hypothetical protein B0H16DRAFT_1461363 [Mycena metata]|uniref:Uncharacterized protein n=1 Tax=Mycena metata TaxID=1033252 RepID=A0AAD7IRX3_9AGAR|nr:hypothetical protein B0H16DRAFT_1461363 [Mycena metata]